MNFFNYFNLYPIVTPMNISGCLVKIPYPVPIPAVIDHF